MDLTEALALKSAAMWQRNLEKHLLPERLLPPGAPRAKPVILSYYMLRQSALESASRGDV